MGRPKSSPKCHPDKRLIARGLCRLCYDRWWREDKGIRSRTSEESEYAKRKAELDASRGRSDYGHARSLMAYGMTGLEYWDMHDRQGGACAICGGSDNGRRLAVDHDHDTGMVRGLLCYRCNMLLGFGRDDTEVLLSAAIYLERTSVNA